MDLANVVLKAWAKVGKLHFPPEKRYGLLQESSRAASRRKTCVQRIADMLMVTILATR